MYLRLSSLPVLLLTVSCGLISSNIGNISFDLPTKSYSFNTNNGMWKLPSGNFPEVLCGADQLVMDCCNPPAPVPQPDCVATPLTCEGDPATVCTLRFVVNVAQKMDLKMEVPVLRSIDSQSLVNITISRIRYTFTSTMNVDLPAIDLYIAPDGVTSPADPSAQKFGTVPITVAGTMGEGEVMLDPMAGPAFSARAHEFGTPFNFIATTTIVVPSGTPIPNGGVDLAVTGRVSAGL